MPRPNTLQPYGAPPCVGCTRTALRVHQHSGPAPSRVGDRSTRVSLHNQDTLGPANRGIPDQVNTSIVRVVRQSVRIAAVLLVASACGKAHASGRQGATHTAPSGPHLDLRSHPDLLFEVFGDANDPRMIPIAAIEHDHLEQIVLDSTGWRDLDAEYLRRSNSYSWYEDGRAIGTVHIRRGMWQRDDALYSLPGCQLLTPMAAVRMEGQGFKPTFTVEYLASTTALGHERNTKAMSSAEVESIARSIGIQAAKVVGIKKQTLDSLDFRAVAFPSGNGPWPTIVAAFIDPAAENPASTQETTTHLIVIADRDSAATDYHTTYTHRVQGPLASSSFRRYFDHLDVTGDGVDEIFLEGWQFGGDTFLSVLSWKDGKWDETYRTRTKWCLD